MLGVRTDFKSKKNHKIKITKNDQINHLKKMSYILLRNDIHCNISDVFRQVLPLNNKSTVSCFSNGLIHLYNYEILLNNIEHQN